MSSINEYRDVLDAHIQELRSGLSPEVLTYLDAMDVAAKAERERWAARESQISERVSLIAKAYGPAWEQALRAAANPDLGRRFTDFTT